MRDLVVQGDQRIAAEAVERWFGGAEAPGGYAAALAEALDDDEIADVARRYRTRFANQGVPWRTAFEVVRLERTPGR